jgi:uncharacterized protein (TIGR03435 family)
LDGDQAVKIFLASLLVLAAAFGAQGQEASAQPRFEVASVKAQPWTGQGSVGIFVRGDTLDAEHVSLVSLVMFAYNLRAVQVSGGPGWAWSGDLFSSELYQAMAKTSGDPPPPMDVFRQMMRTLLADRFQLRVHHGQKDLPVYNLVVKKGGPKLKESQGDEQSDFKVTSVGRLGIRIAAKRLTMQDLIDGQLSAYTDRPIFDKTGLAAPYDFTLFFSAEPPGQEPGPDDPPILATALQEQLGLALETGAAPFDMVIIDHAERPSQN